MNILTYIAIAIGGFVAIGSTLSITLGIFGTIIYKIIRSAEYNSTDNKYYNNSNSYISCHINSIPQAVKICTIALHY